MISCREGGQGPPQSMPEGERTEAQWGHAFMSKDLQKKMGKRLVATKGKI